MTVVLGNRIFFVCHQLLVTVFSFHVLCEASPPNSAGQGVSVLRGKSGFCTFGQSQSCCYGWRSVNGGCQPICKKLCKNGICIGPDRCSCQDGYRGKWCDEDINECGLPRRPCSHSCMNTPGSFRCFCDPGFTLDIDGTSCIKEPDCHGLRCQLSCQIGINGTPSCICPPGLRLEPDNRTCKDIDECAGLAPVCSERQACRNTFGSYTCVCRSGYMLGTVGNAFICRDEDECLTGRHRCSRHARCLNTVGSYTCRCEDAYTGDGLSCRRRKSRSSHKATYFRYKLSKQIRTRLRRDAARQQKN